MYHWLLPAIPAQVSLTYMVGEPVAYATGPRLKATGAVVILGFLTPRSPGSFEAQCGGEPQEPELAVPDSNRPLQLRQVDEHVAQRLRARRRFLRRSEDHVAYRAGVTLQEYREIEAGERRVSAAMIFELSMVLEVPVRFFFEGYAEGAGLSAWAAL